MHPNDPDLHYELGVLHEGRGDFDQAREQLGVALEADPRNVTAQLAMGRVLIKSGSSQDALAPLNQALSLAIQADNAEAKANTLQALGIAFKWLGRPDEALDNLRESLAIKREIGDRRGSAASLSEIGLIQSQQATGAHGRATGGDRSAHIADDQGDAPMRLGELGSPPAIRRCLANAGRRSDPDRNRRRRRAGRLTQQPRHHL
jgi:tetratricopeptide (TPR) repeat protein